MTENFSLKDALFNRNKVCQIAEEIATVYSDFDTLRFIENVVEQFPKLELKARINHIRDMLKQHLPNDYKEATTILLEALPDILDPDKQDDDFGDFIYAPYGEFVATYGCNVEDLTFSLHTLREITKRFSVEFAIRDFINAYPVETLTMLETCAVSENYHERRLASEGLRPKLPWAKKLTIDHTLPLKHLTLLYSDKTRYVTRSVANHLNDISKIDPSLVITQLKRWREENKQTTKEMDYITNHALRTLVKQGDSKALALLGYKQNPAISVQTTLFSTEVKIGEALHFSIEIEAHEEVALLVDYTLFFRTKSGTLNPKVHKLKKLMLQKGEKIRPEKKHLFKANMRTRKLYTGEHEFSLQINGKALERETFMLLVPTSL